MKNEIEYGNRCSIVVLTHDDYDECWDPFFKLLELHWPDLPFPIVLNSEKEYFYSRTIDVIVSDPIEPGSMPWGRRVRKCLEKIESDYILVFCEDFFIEDDVDTKLILQCIDWMDADSNIAVFHFFSARDWKSKKSKYEGFVERPMKGMYRNNLELGLWRRKELLSLIIDEESPWEFEIYGNERSKCSKKKYYALHPQVRMPIRYNIGSGLKGGKWVKPVVEPLFNDIKANVNLYKRGIMGKEDRPDCYKITRYIPRSDIAVDFWCIVCLTKIIKKAICNSKLYMRYALHWKHIYEVRRRRSIS